MAFLKELPPIYAVVTVQEQPLIEHGKLKPHAIIGDGDSLPQAFKEQYKDILHVVEELSNDNDLTKATLAHAKA